MIDNIKVIDSPLCPFCGQKAFIKRIPLIMEDKVRLFCSCGFEIERSGSKGTMEKVIQLVISKWNRRALESKDA